MNYYEHPHYTREKEKKEIRKEKYSSLIDPRITALLCLRNLPGDIPSLKLETVTAMSTQKKIMVNLH